MEFWSKYTDDAVPVIELTIKPIQGKDVTFTFLELQDALQEIVDWSTAGDANAENN